MAYIGSSPTKVVSRQSANIFTYTATANQTAFTGSDANGNTLACTPSDIMVHMNGIKLEENDYTASTTTVTLASGAAAGDEITITAFVTFESADHYNKSTADTRYVNTTGDTMSGSLSVSTSGNSSLTLQTSSASNSVSTNFQSANRTYYAGVDIGGANSSFTVYDGTAGAERFRINSSGIVTMPNQPSFHAKLTSNQTGHNSASLGNHFVTYDSELVDQGNNHSNGVFTAPVTGTYFFKAEAYGSTNFSQAWLVINGGRADGTDTVYYTATNFVYYENIVHLSANDTVSFHPYKSGQTSDTIYANANHTYWKGHLLG